MFGVETRLLKPVLETLQSLLREGDMHLLLRDRDDRAQHDMVATGGEANKLPVPGEILWNFVNCQVFDEDAEQPLVEAMGEIEFPAAPVRRDPGFGHEEQHRLTAVGRLVELSFPAVARCNPARRIQVQKNFVFPAFALQPIMQSHGFCIICARMT